MEEWEDELQERLNEIVQEQIEKGFTVRQCCGVLDTLKFELIYNLGEVEFTPEKK
jgi:hypothetical protein